MQILIKKARFQQELLAAYRYFIECLATAKYSTVADGILNL